MNEEAPWTVTSSGRSVIREPATDLSMQERGPAPNPGRPSRACWRPIPAGYGVTFTSTTAVCQSLLTGPPISPAVQMLLRLAGSWATAK
jgi:hypothetical protein